MKKLFLGVILAFSVSKPIFAADYERVDALVVEIDKYQIKQYLLPFENYLNMINGNSGDTMAANSIVDSLNALTKKYPTVSDMHALLVELLDSGYYEDPPMLMFTLRYSLEKAKEYGFGSGKLSPWQFKHMSRFKPQSTCGKSQDNVYYTTVKHPSKNYNFGFYLSAGMGFVDQQKLKTKVIGEECI